MALKRKARRGHTNIVDSDPEDGPVLASAPRPTDDFLRETVRMGVDGSVMQAVKMISVPASPGRSSTVQHLLPDEVRPVESPASTPQRCFDMYEEEEDGLVDSMGDDEDAPRDLRDSVRVDVYISWRYLSDTLPGLPTT